MSVRTDVINLNVNVNGNKSQDELNNLRKRAADLNFEMKGLKKGTQEYIDKSKELGKVNADMAELKKTIGITALSQKELTKELRTLTALRGSVVPFSKEYDELSKSIKVVESRLYDVKNGVQGFASFFSKIKDEVKQFGAVAAGYLGFQFLASSFQNIIQGAGKLSDQLADLRRVAGLTADEAKTLNSALGRIDTRTSTSQLREIAIVAGKLGVAKDDIISFTEATDKLVVALGDELGNADEITTQLGKILNVFNGAVDGDSLTKLGNAVVELANAGVATGGFISDFTQRVAGLAKASNLSLGTTVGLAAGFEELGLRSESSATALQKLVSTIAADLPKAANIAGAKSAEEVQKFADLFAKAPQEALIKFAEGLTQNKASFAEITTSFKDAGEEGARVVQTLQAIGQRGDFLREKIELGNKSIQESTAINEAFALKNENLGATIDKLGKEFAKFVNSSAVTNFLKGAVENVLAFIKALQQIPKFISDNSVAIGLLTAAIIVQNAARIKNIALIALEKSGLKDLLLNITSVTIAEKAAAIATTTWSLVTAVLSGNMKKAAAEFKLLQLLIGANPLAVFLVALGAAVIAFKALAEASSKASAAERVRQEVFSRANEAIAEQAAKMQYLTTVIKDNSISLETRQGALKELIALNPEYLKGLTLENIATKEGAKILEDYNLQLQNRARLQASQTILAEKAKQDVDLALQQQEIERGIAAAGPNRLNYKPDYDLKKIKEQRTELKSEMDEIVKLAIGFQKSNDALDAKVAAPITKAVTGPSGPLQRTIEQIRADIKATEEGIEKAGVGTKLLKDLLAKRKALEKELNDALGIQTGGGRSGAKKQTDEYGDLLKKAQEFYEKIKLIRKKSFAKNGTPEEDELAATTLKYEELLKEAKEFSDKLQKLAKGDKAKRAAAQKLYDDEEKLLLEAQQNDLLEIRKKYNEKNFAARTQEEYQQSLNDSAEYFRDARQQAAENYSAGIIDKTGYEIELNRIDRRETLARLNIAYDYKDNVKKAAEDLTAAEAKEEARRTADAVKATDTRLENAAREAAAKLDLEIKNARGPLQRRDARLNQNDASKQAALAKLANDKLYAEQTLGITLDTEEQRLAILKEYSEQEKQIRRDAFDDIVNTVGEGLQLFQQYVAPLFQAFDDLQNARAAKELAREKKLNDQKVNLFKKQLDAKLISQAVYDRKTAAANEAYAAKERALKREQAERDRKAKIFQAVIGGALAIVQAFAQLGPIAGAIAAVLIGITTGLQIAAIKNAPLPELGRGGKLKQGPKHKDASRGLHVVNPDTGRVEALVERNEAIMSSNTMDDPNHYTVSGTPSQISSTLNGINGGTTWDSPAKVVPISSRPSWQGKPLPQVSSRMPKIMADGGKIGSPAPIQDNSETNDLLRQLITEQRATRESINQFDREKKSYVVLKEIKAAEQTYDQSKAASGF